MSATTRILVPRTVDAAAVAPFGQLLEGPGEAWRQDFAAALHNGRATARANLALVRAQPAPPRLAIDRLERHPYSSQAFFPLDAEEYLVVVCRDDGSGRPDPSSLAAFRVKGTQAVNYAPGIWHHGMTTLRRAGVLAMLVHEDGTPDDCHYQPIEPFEVHQ
jgi:ureidoglycolate lyase